MVFQPRAYYEHVVQRSRPRKAGAGTDLDPEELVEGIKAGEDDVKLRKRVATGSRGNPKNNGKKPYMSRFVELC